MLPLCQSIARVFARLGEKKARSKARLKFLVEKMGLDAFRAAVNEIDRLPVDRRWTAWMDEAEEWSDAPLRPAPVSSAARRAEPSGADAARWQSWRRTSTSPRSARPGFRW